MLAKRIQPSKRQLKLQGAIECLDMLLKHCHGHLFDVDEEAVTSCLRETKKNLRQLLSKKKGK